MARIRTFIAVDVGEEIASRILTLQEELRKKGSGVKWVEEENLHITLHFLGDVDELDLVKICRVVKEQAANVPPFTLEVAGVGAFPNLRRPKILWTGVNTGLESLTALHAALEAPLMELGCYRREDRTYTPHLTLGRITQEDRQESWGSLLNKYQDWSAGETTIDEVLVMSSELLRDGPVYTVVGRGQLLGQSSSAKKKNRDV